MKSEIIGKIGTHDDLVVSRNTNTITVKLWANDGGTMKSVTLT